MPIESLTGSTANAIDASRMQGGVNAGNKASLLAGLAKFGTGMGDAMAQKMMRDHMVEIGLDPELARDPHTAVQAILAKHEEDIKQQEQAAAGKATGLPGDTSHLPTQIATNLYDQGQENTRQQAGFANKTAEDTAIGGQVAQLSAPTVSEDTVSKADPNSPNFDPSAQPQMGEVGQEGIDARAARMPGVRASAISQAAKNVKMGEGNPALDEQRRATAKLRDAQAGLATAKTGDVGSQAEFRKAQLALRKQGLSDRAAYWTATINERTRHDSAAEGNAADANAVAATRAQTSKDQLAALQQWHAELAQEKGTDQRIRKVGDQLAALARMEVPDKAGIATLRTEMEAIDTDTTMEPGPAPTPPAPGAAGAAPGAGGSPAPAAAAPPTPAELATIQGNPAMKAAWDAYTPEEKARALASLRKATGK